MPFSCTSSKFSCTDAPESGWSLLDYFCSSERSTLLNSSISFFFAFCYVFPLSRLISSSFSMSICLALVLIISLSDYNTAYSDVIAIIRYSISLLCACSSRTSSFFSSSASCTFSFTSSSMRRTACSCFVGDSLSVVSLILLLSSSFSSWSWRFLLVSCDSSRSSCALLVLSCSD